MPEGDTYNVGQAGAVGPNAHAHHMTFQQTEASREDLTALAKQLDDLRKAMRADASEPDHDEALGAVAAAQKAAAAGDKAGAFDKLKSAGKWALGVAEKIGVDVAAAAIKTAMGYS
jgi:hypothetical protein